MPEVKLTIADLAYMTGLMPGGTRCYGNTKVTDRLIFLGLIEFADIPPCSKAIAAHKATEEDNWKAIKAAVKSGDRDTVYRIGNDWRYGRDRLPKSEKGYRLTKSGVEFMAKGRATTVTAMKGACLNGR